jgi:glutamate synthase (NADPH/NADH) small chain
MQGFFEQDREEAKKRDVVVRIKDYDEIYEVFGSKRARRQSERCVQCGDPYCHSDNGCPLHNFIPHWLKATADRDIEFAFNLSNDSSPFPEVMGRICPHDRLCEGACTLNDGHGAVTIGSVEAYISEEGFKQGLKPRFAAEKIGKKVAIVGAGPAGLSAATFLAREGVDVEIFDKQKRPGGLLTYGIPGFKLNKNVIARRVDLLKEAGVVFHQETEVGTDVMLEDLIERFDAVFLGTGATKGRKAGINGEEAHGVYLAMEFLVSVQKKLFGEACEHPIDVREKRVAVIGGGDTAMDCVRTSLREEAKSVTCYYRRDAHGMPGSRKEYVNAKEEGVVFEFYTAPKQILKNDKGEVIGIEMVKTQLGEPDSSGRRRVEEVPGSTFTVEADVVIYALGFDPVEYPFLAENGIETDKWGGVIVDANYQTTKTGVYAGGDCHRGADLVVTAAYDGREAARAMIEAFAGA